MRSAAPDSIQQLVYSRQLGHRRPLGQLDHVKTQLYSAVRSISSWDPAASTQDTHHGSIFNFDFSTDGSLLAAACERKSLLLFDPHNGRLILSKNDAHADCVNCIRFLDTRMFATCSDDTTVCLWDARFLKSKVRTLENHSNWVKNIDYARDLELLMTSGFDGCIYTWDINSYSEKDQTHCRRVFHTNGLMRSKLSPDASKLIIATATGYLMVVHDLDLTRLPDDLAGFKPNMYRLMQMSRARPRMNYMYDSLFTRKRNRVELISDFPAQDDAELISSLEVHPQGWCVCSRNTTNDENTEWTCVHDIQGSLDDLESYRDDKSDHTPSPSVFSGTDGFFGGTPSVSQDCWVDTDSRMSGRGGVSRNLVSPLTVSVRMLGPSTSPILSSQSTISEEDSEDEDDEPEPPVLLPPVAESATAQLQVEVDDQLQSSSARSTPNHILMMDSAMFLPPSTPSPSDRFSAWATHWGRFTGSPSASPREFILRKNIPRLTHYIEEPNVGRGFIKELCFSPDGRLICSPFGFGVRLLGFDSSCREMCDCLGSGTPMTLREVGSNMSHRREVVTVKFSPTHCLLVSGCLDGKVSFHQPVL